MSSSLLGSRIELRPLNLADVAELIEAATDGELWHSIHTIVPSPQTMATYVESALQRQSAGLEMPYTIRLRESGRVVGSTRFREPQPVHRTVEISHIWVARSQQRGFANAEAQYLMLRHAFDELACIRVQYRADEDNAVSRGSLERLGARQEGILRNERIMPDGRKRSTAIYSIIDDEWPAVRAALEERLAAMP